MPGGCARLFGYTATKPPGTPRRRDVHDNPGHGAGTLPCPVTCRSMKEFPPSGPNPPLPNLCQECATGSWARNGNRGRVVPAFDVADQVDGPGLVVEGQVAVAVERDDRQVRASLAWRRQPKAVQQRRAVDLVADIEGWYDATPEYGRQAQQ